MRIIPLTAVALLAIGVISCADSAPTDLRASARAPGTPLLVAARSHGGARAEVDIPAPGGFVSTPLSRGSFRDAIDATFRIRLADEHRTHVVHVDDPTQMVMASVSMAPGGALPWHTHPGPALVTIVAGELTFVDGDDCSVRRYGPGASFMDPGQGHVHVAFNAGAVPMLLYVTYLDVPIGQSPLVVPPPPVPDC